jgi:hypothetical protein
MSTFQCNAHDWQLDLKANVYVCPLCDSTTQPCIECGDPLRGELPVCERCINRGKKVVEDVASWIDDGLKQDPYAPLHSPAYDRDQITTGEDDERLPFGLDAVVSDPDDKRISALKTVPDAVTVLAEWAAAWQRDGDIVTSITDPLEFLPAYTQWALLNQAESRWPVYLKEARQVRSLVRRLIGLAPVREAVPCVHCGGTIVRYWTDSGIDEVRKCTGCSMTWEHESRLMHTNLVVLQQLPTTHPDTLVTLEEANRIYRGRVPRNLFHMWFTRERITVKESDVRGFPKFRLGDIEDLMRIREKDSA